MILEKCVSEHITQNGFYSLWLILELFLLKMKNYKMAEATF